MIISISGGGYVEYLLCANGTVVDLGWWNVQRVEFVA